MSADVTVSGLMGHESFEQKAVLRSMVMCGGVQFKHEGNNTLKVYFPSPQAVLPVCLKSGGHVLLPWGRREGEAGSLPVGGWARHESILAGKWDRFFPKAVRLDLEAFMEKDNQGKSHWYPLTVSDAVQALVARQGDEHASMWSPSHRRCQTKRRFIRAGHASYSRAATFALHLTPNQI